ncbi:MAG: hypothetical protein AABX01_08430 [Candidatus Micrarchaeota archaeon]
MAHKGFIFSLEAAITLLIAISLISAIRYLPLPTYSDLYLQQLANDFQQIAAKGYYSEFADFSRGNLLAKEKIRSEFEDLIFQLGNYCLIIDARANSMKINCGNKNENNFKKIIPTSRIFYDGDVFFELKMRLIV